jgi:hypothetical protein
MRSPVLLGSSGIYLPHPARAAREPLVRPFGFKGGYMSEIWQTVVRLESRDVQAFTGIEIAARASCASRPARSGS